MNQPTPQPLTWRERIRQRRLTPEKPADRRYRRLVAITTRVWLILILACFLVFCFSFFFLLGTGRRPHLASSWLGTTLAILFLVALALGLLTVGMWARRNVRFQTRLHLDEVLLLIAVGTMILGGFLRLTVGGGQSGAGVSRQAVIWAPLIYVTLWLGSRWGRRMASKLGATSARQRFLLLFMGWMALPGWLAIAVLLLRLGLDPWFLSRADPGTSTYWVENGILGAVSLLVLPTLVMELYYRRLQDQRIRDRAHQRAHQQLRRGLPDQARTAGPVTGEDPVAPGSREVAPPVDP